jgi:hypothetical protein
MPAKLRLPSGTVLVIDNYVWSCEAAPFLANELNESKTGSDSVNMAASADPDFDEATRVASFLGGEIFDNSQFMVRVPGRVY